MFTGVPGEVAVWIPLEENGQRNGPLESPTEHLNVDDTPLYPGSQRIAPAEKVTERNVYSYLIPAESIDASSVEAIAGRTSQIWIRGSDKLQIQSVRIFHEHITNGVAPLD